MPKAKDNPIDKLSEKVRQVIADQLGKDVVDISLTTRFAEDLDTDSLDNVEILMAFEEAFDISIADDDADGILTVQDAVNYLRNVAKVT